MSTDNVSTGKYWMLFLISSVLMFAFILFLPEWFWVMLPFVCTALVKALNWM